MNDHQATASDAATRSVKVFISYASEDAEISDSVRNELMALAPTEITVFLDCIDIHAGDNWHDVIESSDKEFPVVSMHIHRQSTRRFLISRL